MSYWEPFTEDASLAMTRAAQLATDTAESIGPDQLFIAAAQGTPVSQILERLGTRPDALQEAIASLAPGNARVTQDEAVFSRRGKDTHHARVLENDFIAAEHLVLALHCLRV